MLACGACLPGWPEQCITEGDPINMIDVGKCTDYAACAGVGPTASRLAA